MPPITAKQGASAEQAMQTLTAQWYNAIVTGCGLSPAMFQLVQGYEPAGTTSEWLWNMFDAVPPKSVGSYYDPAQIDSFSQAYGGVISALIAQGALQFERDMGDYYAQWNAAKQKLSPMPSTPLDWINAFTNWANQNLPQSQVSTCINDYKSALLDPIYLATNMLTQVQFAQKNSNVYAYDTTYNALQVALNSAAPKSTTMDSKTTSSDLTKTWAKAEAGGFYDIFGGGGSSSYQSSTLKMTNAGVSITARFEKLVTLSAGPLRQPSSDTYLQGFTPWFNSAALNAGYKSQSNDVWKPGDAVNWDSAFGPDGNLQRYCSALVIVDGILVTMTSKAGLSKAEQASFQAQAEVGIFPFFEASASGGWSNQASFDDAGNITVTSSCPTGNPQVLGVLVSQIANIFG